MPVNILFLPPFLHKPEKINIWALLTSFPLSQYFTFAALTIPTLTGLMPMIAPAPIMRLGPCPIIVGIPDSALTIALTGYLRREWAGRAENSSGQNNGSNKSDTYEDVNKANI